MQVLLFNKEIKIKIKLFNLNLILNNKKLIIFLLLLLIKIIILTINLNLIFNHKDNGWILLFSQESEMKFRLINLSQIISHRNSITVNKSLIRKEKILFINLRMNTSRRKHLFIQILKYSWAIKIKIQLLTLKMILNL